MQQPTDAPLFQSFWMGGFESACHINRAGTRLDMIAATQHDVQAEADYQLLAAQNIRTVREGVRWPLIERGGDYDFASLRPMVEAASRQGVQVLWALCHYGVPDDLDLFGAAFVERFARFAKATAAFIAEHSAVPPIFIPMNEISFFTWAAGDVAYIHPCATGRGHELKRQLVRAAITAIDAVWEAVPGARIAHVEPLINVVPPKNRPDLARIARINHEGQFEAWDMLSGRMRPELGGHPRYLDITGVNFYHANQWEYHREDQHVRLRWEDYPRDKRWVPLHQLLANVYKRYRRPLFIGETSHVGVGRGTWIAEIAHEAALAFEQGVPLEGICIYPIIDRPDWDNANHWHHAGLWDVRVNDAGRLERVLDAPYAQALRGAMAQVNERLQVRMLEA